MGLEPEKSYELGGGIGFLGQYDSWESKVPLVSLNKALLSPYSLEGVGFGGGTLDSHE